MNPTQLIPVFHVTNVEAAVQYYIDKLGFKLSFKYGTYAGIELGPCELHLTDPGEPRHIPGAGTAYLLCDEVDTYFAQVKAAGAKVKAEPANRVYGMRDFAVTDLDGNLISFGCDVEK